MPFGQFVVGPPGSGKTTYCHGVYQFLMGTGRKTIIVNLDPANDILPYECAIDITELIDLEKVMKEEKLGPNGALVFCVEYINVNLDWLIKKLESFSDCYILFDCPGQIELYTHHSAIHSIVSALQDKHSYRLTAVHLVDSFYCSQASTFISVLLTSLSTMLKLELPCVHVLSKIDSVLARGDLGMRSDIYSFFECPNVKFVAFNLEFYTDVLNLDYLVKTLDNDMFSKKYQMLNKALCTLIDDFRFVSFHTLCIEDKGSVLAVIRSVDKANGFLFGGLTDGNESIFLLSECPTQFQDERIGNVQEKYIDSWE